MVQKHTKRLLKKTDNFVIPLMKQVGHKTERCLLAFIFVWFGTLKLLGETSATSIIARSIYWLEPAFMVPTLGVWEIAIGLFLMTKSTLRFALLLLFIRLPGTVLALFYHSKECFHGVIWLPTIQGQYLIKDLTLFGAALVIGSTIQFEKHKYETDEKNT